MKERFINVKAEQRTGIPERWLPAFEFPSQVQPFARIVLSLPGGEKVSERAIRDEADEILERVEALRQKSAKTSRGTVLDLLRRHGRKISVPAAFAGGVAAVYAGDLALKTGKIMTGRVTLDDVTEWETGPALENLPSYEEMRLELESAIGRDRLQEQIPVRSPDYVRSVRAKRAEQEKSAERLSVSLESGLPDERVREIIQETTPRSWTGIRAIGHLTISPERIPMPREYGIEGYADGLCEHGVSHEASGIRLSPDFKTQPISFNVLIHEFVHANDWQRSNALSPEDRLTLLYLTHKRVTADDRIHFGNVEEIKNSDSHERQMRRITEYWAELMTMAMDLPAKDEAEWTSKFRVDALLRGAKATAEKGKALAPGEPDMRIVRWHLSVTDPDFKPWEAKRRRTSMVDDLVKEGIDHGIKDALDELPPGKFRASLAALLERKEENESVIVRDLHSFEEAQIKTASGSLSLSRLSKPLQEYWIALADGQHKAFDALSQHTPDDLRAAIAAYGALLEKIDGWRINRDRGFMVNLDLQNPREEYFVKEVSSCALNLLRATRGLEAEEMRELERLAAEYLKIFSGGFEVRADRPAALDSELKGLFP